MPDVGTSTTDTAAEREVSSSPRRVHALRCSCHDSYRRCFSRPRNAWDKRSLCTTRTAVSEPGWNTPGLTQPTRTRPSSNLLDNTRRACASSATGKTSKTCRHKQTGNPKQRTNQAHADTHTSTSTHTSTHTHPPTHIHPSTIAGAQVFTHDQRTCSTQVTATLVQAVSSYHQDRQQHPRTR